VRASLRIEKLNRTHPVEPFTCGQAELDRFLVRHALQAQQTNSSQTYVAVDGGEVVGYHTIVAGEVRHADAPARVVKGMPRHPIPLLVLARLAVHSARQGRGIGAGLLLDALGRTLQVADVIGVRALAVHAKDDRASAFYRHFGFTPSPTDTRHLFMIIKDIRQAADLHT
jgi:GNAT superfamily N-acetyltransferase